ncbi:MAG TPA: hypothetical protein VF033_14920 [Steroidobacteraceae bacterium]
MSHRNPNEASRIAAAVVIAALFALSLAGCDPAPQVDAEKTAPPSNETPAATPDSGSTPAEVPPPEDTPAAPAQPPPEAPPPTEPSPAAKPTSAVEPALDSMRTARAPAKLSVPVDLKYSFDTEPLANQPVTLHLAAVPRVPGTNLTVSVKAADGIRVASAGNLNVQKVSANGAYRQQFSVTRQASVPELRVLITMDLPEGSGFGFYSIPFDAGKKSQKPDSVKQR